MGKAVLETSMFRQHAPGVGCTEEIKDVFYNECQTNLTYVPGKSPFAAYMTDG